MNRKCFFIAAAVLMTAIPALFADITSRLDFSTDDGKTWSPDFPVLSVEKPECLLKVSWYASEVRPVKSGIVVSDIRCFEQDFASANSGKGSEQGRPCWRQRIPVYWKAIKSAEPYIYRLNFGKRAAADRLPGCEAWKPGVYLLYSDIRYYMEKDNQPRFDRQLFYITIQQQPQTGKEKQL